MSSWIDGSLYPDVEPPDTITTIEERSDFLSRFCGAWDFGILPEPETVAEILGGEWRDAVDATQFLTSLSYHLVRHWHGLPKLPYLGSARSLPIDRKLLGQLCELQISEMDVQRGMSELAIRAEGRLEIVLTSHGRPALGLVAIKSLPAIIDRRAVLEKVRAVGAASATKGPTAARSQDFLYGEDGLPE